MAPSRYLEVKELSVNRFPLLSKTAVIGLLMVLLLVPLAMVRDVIQERTQHRETATREVARAHAGAQTLTGPVLLVPYTETYVRTVVVNAEVRQTREEQVTQARMLTVFPAAMETRSRLQTETRWRGISPSPSTPAGTRARAASSGRACSRRKRAARSRWAGPTWPWA